jgi:hypothetical protein
MFSVSLNSISNVEGDHQAARTVHYAVIEALFEEFNSFSEINWNTSPGSSTPE